MSQESKKRHTTKDLASHPFSKTVLYDAVRINGAIQVIESTLKANVEYKRVPTQAEYYCIATGNSLAHFLSICQQLEHSVLYFSSFAPTERMEKAGINKHSYLLYCIENYIIRTQSMYDRLLRLIDKTFCLYNPSHLISHELIISNTHVKHTPVPSELKSIRKIIKDYYRDRNEIMHEREYLEDDLRRLEAYTLLTHDEPYQTDMHFKVATKKLTREIIKGKTSLFTRVNSEAFMAISSLFDFLKKKYDGQRKLLEAIHGEIEVLTDKAGNR